MVQASLEPGDFLPTQDDTVQRRKVWNVLLWEAALHASAVAISVDDAALPSWRRAGRVPPRTSFLGSFCVFANFVGLLPSAYGITRTLIEATILIWPTRTLDGKIGSMSRGRMASPSPGDLNLFEKWQKDGESRCR